MADVVGRRVRMAAGLLVLAEFVVFVLVAGWIGVGWTILAHAGHQRAGLRAAGPAGHEGARRLRDRARARRPAGRELGDAGLIAVGGLLMVLPGFLGDLLGLLCLLPVTRGLVRAALTPAVVLAGCPTGLRGRRCGSSSVRTAGRTGPGAADARPGGAAGHRGRGRPRAPGTAARAA